MIRVLSCAALVGAAVLAIGQEPVQRGKIKKLDADKGVVTIASSGAKDLELSVMEATRFMSAAGTPLKDGLRDKSFKEGAAVMFKSVAKGDENLLIGMRLVEPQAKLSSMPKVDTSRLKPLTEMGADDYHGFKGGLYPDGKNQRPLVHEKAGLKFAGSVQPLDAQGKPSDQGKIVLLSIGMSNTTQVFSVFKRLADPDPAKNPNLVIVDGAQGGMTAARIQNPDGKDGGLQFWSTVNKRLETAGVTAHQVQAIWLKEADARPTQAFPKHAKILQEELTQIVQLLPRRFGNVKLVYLSSRTYGGYARTPLNPEPYAFESGFSVKWLIQNQIDGNPELNYDSAKGPPKAPWLSWGPYLWANGMSKRADGFFYEESDYAGDGTHPSAAGQTKVGRMLLEFFKKDETTRGWFVRFTGI